MDIYSEDGPNDLEGAGPGGGADIVREQEAEPTPGSRLGLAVTVVLAALVLLVPVLWAAGVCLVIRREGLAAAGYLLLVIHRGRRRLFLSAVPQERVGCGQAAANLYDGGRTRRERPRRDGGDPECCACLPSSFSCSARARCWPRRRPYRPALSIRLRVWMVAWGAGLSLGPVIETRKHTTFGAERWKGPDDLCARVWFGWDAANFYLAADVRDDMVDQPHRGGALYRGDHIELFVRTRPESRPADRFAEGDWQFGFSPGNFSSTGDPLADIAPEGVVFWPANTAVEGMRVAALRTEAHTWKPLSLSLRRCEAGGQELAVEVAISIATAAAAADC